MKQLVKCDCIPRLLIGAPRAKALSNQGANITGGLYSCDVTTQSDDCKRIEFDNEGEHSTDPQTHTDPT